MALRVHFTAEDLTRVRVLDAPDPLWEIVLSLNLLFGGRGRAAFGRPWSSGARDPLLSGVSGRHLSLLRHLAPPVGDFPDFLTPQRTDRDPETAIETILGTPKSRLRQGVSVLPTVPASLWPLANGEVDALRELGSALRAYYRAALACRWERISALSAADRALRARAVSDRGIDGLLGSLRPALGWSSPVLTAQYPVDRDLYLDGRGILLIPSVFCRRTPVTHIDAELPPVLVYPAVHPADLWNKGTDQSLAALLGAGRAAVLHALEEGCTTGELARRVGVAAPTVSLHTSVLRNAGLIVSVRHGNLVLHTPTPLGTALLRSNS
ncbi:ArsR/SmtB family transcription factor [Streptomyces sp. NBC_00859]|uniref:ArsR/SmtB family transcription factor n=1 Tax=Streptomyces sp. NBC_00859 TaxID=2903682 RepID=UPI00386D4187|nr:helix-turn-helix domain-containing protein [Streptomyces sp. NBC_00859]